MNPTPSKRSVEKRSDVIEHHGLGVTTYGKRTRLMPAKPKRTHRKERRSLSQPPSVPPPPVYAPPVVRKRKMFLVDDHPMVRERLAELISQEADLEVCGEAEDAVAAHQAHRPAPAGPRDRRHHAEGHLRDRAGQDPEGAASPHCPCWSSRCTRVAVRRTRPSAPAHGVPEQAGGQQEGRRPRSARSSRARSSSATR